MTTRALRTLLSDMVLPLLTPCSPAVRRMGYLDEAIAMRGRYLRNRAAWQPHLEKTRQFVVTAAERCGNRTTVVVFGSGLLLDVPLAELSKMFREVVLTDVVCLPEVRRQIRKYGNVRFVEHDATGIAKRLSEHPPDSLAELPESSPALPVINHAAGLVVSLNILSQLWVVPRAYAAQRLRGLPADRTDEWCRSLVEAHYRFLRSLSCAVCLIADYAFVKRDAEGQIISRSSTIFRMPLPEPEESWTWTIAPLGQDSPFLSKELIVGAWQVR